MVQGFKKGFSLVELLVVIAIIGILAAVGITAYSGYTNSAKEKATLANHAQILATLNSEFAKCAAGSGDFVWGSGGSSCAAAPDAGEVVIYFATMGLKNPYARTVDQVSEAKNDAGAAWDGADGTHTSVLGGTAVHCTVAGCNVATNPGDGGNPAAADTFKATTIY